MTEVKAKDECKACMADLSQDNAIGVKDGYIFLKCPACRTVTVSPFPTEDELIAFYQHYRGTPGYSAKSEKKIRRAKKRIRKILKYSNGDKFLDVGCNVGFTVAAARELGLDAGGIDVDCDAIDVAKQQFGEGLFDCGKVQDFAYSGKQFDIIYTSEVIEHVPDPDSFVNALSQLLIPGGVLYLTTPDGNHFSLPKNFSEWIAAVPPEHIIYFSVQGIRETLSRHGFKIEKIFFNLKPGIRLIGRKI